MSPKPLTSPAADERLALIAAAWGSLATSRRAEQLGLLERAR